MKKEFKSNIGNICISYEVMNDVALMDYINYDEEYVKIFLITLKTSISELKNMNVRKIYQNVYVEDWNKYLKKNENWNIANINNDVYTIYCDIESSLENILNGLGIFENKTDYKTCINDN